MNRNFQHLRQYRVGSRPYSLLFMLVAVLLVGGCPTESDRRLREPLPSGEGNHDSQASVAPGEPTTATTATTRPAEPPTITHQYGGPAWNGGDSYFEPSEDGSSVDADGESADWRAAQVQTLRGQGAGGINGGVFARTRTYRTDADFAEGVLSNVNFSDIPNQIQMNEAILTPYPYINIAASGRGTIVRIDVNSGVIVGEYRTAPGNLPRDPSRTTVDLEGNVWCGNRGQGDPGSVVKVGLLIGGTRGNKNQDGSFTPDINGEYVAPPFDYNTCIDRDGDGLIRTSRGFNHILAWSNVTDGSGGSGSGPALVEDALDEAILIFQRLPGTRRVRHVSVTAQNDVWVGGWDSFSVNTFWKLSGTTGGRLASFVNSSICSGNMGGYGGLIDSNNVLWSASSNSSGSKLLRFDLTNQTGVCLDAPNSYGLTVDRDGNIWNCLYQLHQVRKFAPDGQILGTFPIGAQGARGLAASPLDGDIWIAASISQRVCRLSSDGVVRKTISTGGSDPTGVAIDSNGKVWVTNNGAGTVIRIDPNGGADGLGAVDLSLNIGGSVYNYSDMTGTVVVGSTAPQGTWTTVYDGQQVDLDWGRISWTSAEPTGTSVAVRVRAANSVDDLLAAPYSLISNGQSFARTGVVGRYIQIQATLTRPGGSELTPVLYDLTVSAADSFSDSTLAVDLKFEDTSYNRERRLLVVKAQAENVAPYVLDAPLVLVIDTISDPAVTIANPDGYTPEGKPYFMFLAPGFGPPVLHPGERTPPKMLIFGNTGGEISFTRTWLAAENAPPEIASLPPGSTLAGRLFAYAIAATDPDGHSVEYSKLFGPRLLSVDRTTGQVLWTPELTDIGTHSVAVTATDSRGASTTQQFVIEVLEPSINRPPVFVSTPQPHSPVGAQYLYQAAAADPDSDDLAYVKIVGPQALGVSPDGLAVWDFALPPGGQVGIEAADGRGAAAQQFFSLTVGDRPENPTAPSLLGVPGSIAVVNQPYVYQPVANDPDAGDTLYFSLPVNPGGVSVNAQTGRVTWTPTSQQLGPRTIQVRVDDRPDGTGGAATQQWSVEVVATAPNQSPYIESIPSFFAVVDQPYAYQVRAGDPDAGQSLTFSIIEPPDPSMTIDPVTGLLSWTPASVGPVTVAIRVTDNGAPAKTGNQVYVLNVSPPNIPPVIVSTPQTSIVVGATYRYDVNAQDGNGHAVRYSLTAAPQGMIIDANTGLITWVPMPSQIGTHSVTVLADDLYGGTDTQDFEVEVRPDTRPPAVRIVPTPNPAIVNQPVQLCVQATDDGQIVGRTLSIEGVPVALDDSGCYSFMPTEIRILELSATATDGAENVGHATLNYQVVDPSDPTAPDVSLHSPTPEATVTSPIPVIATITDNTPEALVWQLRLTRGNETDFKVIAEGTGEVVNGQIALLDPTLLPNDAYALTLFADDGVHSVTSGYFVNVAGEKKLGNFSVSFTDLTIPVAGIPLVITRQYDSLDAQPGDFGPGWRLGLPGLVQDAAREYPTFEPLGVGQRVYVTRPDGRRVGFKVRVEPLPWFSFFVRVRFDPEPGVSEQLSLPDPDQIVANIGGFLYADIFGGPPFNPSLYHFTSKEKVKYRIDEIAGLQRIEDIFGNTIDVTPGGLISSTGVSLTFVRDALGRITQIVEPVDPNDPDPPGTLDYVYDPVTGNLEEFWTQQKSDPPTRYHYENVQHPHYLTKVEDPLGNPIVQNVYDDSGRLVGQCNAMGDVGGLPADPCADPDSVPDNCTMFCLDPIGGIQTIINARGYRTDLVLDDRGNVIQERKFSADGTYMLVTQRTYWTTAGGEPTDWLHTESLQTRVLVGQSVGTLQVRLTLTYDNRGNVLTRTEHGDEDRTWTYTYWPGCDEVWTETDPMANVTTYEYDADCNLRFITDALGGVTEFRYNDRGQRTHFIDAVVWNGTHPNVWQFHYDEYGLPSGVTDPLGNSSQTRFNLAGELEYQIDRRGWRIDFTYDDAHRVRQEIWRPNLDAIEPGDLDQDRVTEYSYNGVGLLTSAVDPDSALTIDYWPTGFVKWVDNVGTPGAPRVRITYGHWDSGVLRDGYDANGSLTHVMDEWGAGTPSPQGLTEYRYDEFDRLVTGLQYSVGGQVNPKRVDIQYLDTGLMQWIRRYSDLAGGQNVANSFYEYDCSGCPLLLNQIRHERPDLSPIEVRTYVRDRTGSIRSLQDRDGVHTISYDGLGRMTAVDRPTGSSRPDESYSSTERPYDQVGNRRTSHLSTRYHYSYETTAGNLLTSDDSYDYEYDSEGNVISIYSRANGSNLSLKYDHDGRLTSVAKRLSDGSTAWHQRFVYDVARRRICVTSDAFSEFRAFSGLNLVATHDGVSIRERVFVTPSIDEILGTETEGETRWLLGDLQGSVNSVVSDGGSVLAEVDYDSFGQRFARFGDLSSTRFGFHGREHDELSEFGDFRIRSYMPRLGRFIQGDPLEPFGYEYGLNNPLLFIDATGLVSLSEYGQLLRNIAARVTSSAKAIGCKAVFVISLGAALVGPAGGDLAQAVGKAANAHRRAIEQAERAARRAAKKACKGGIEGPPR